MRNAGAPVIASRGAPASRAGGTAARQVHQGAPRAGACKQQYEIHYRGAHLRFRRRRVRPEPEHLHQQVTGERQPEPDSQCPAAV